MKKYIIISVLAMGMANNAWCMEVVAALRRANEASYAAADAKAAAAKTQGLTPVQERTQQFIAASKLDVANLTPVLAGHDVPMRAKVRVRRLSGDAATGLPWLSSDAVVTDAVGYADLKQKQNAVAFEEERIKKEKQEKLDGAAEVTAKLQKHSAMLAGTCGVILYMWKHEVIERMAYKFGPFVGGLLPQAVITLLLHNLTNKVWTGGNQWWSLPDEVAAMDRKLAALATQKAQLAQQKVENLVPALKIGISPVRPHDWHNPKPATPKDDETKKA